MSDVDGLLAKAKIITGFINSVGVPAFLLIVILAIAYGTWAGYIESPIATRVQVDAHAANTQQLHGTLIDIAREQVEVLKGIQKEFKATRCERESKSDEKVACLSKLFREPDQDNPIHRRYRMPND